MHIDGPRIAGPADHSRGIDTHRLKLPQRRRIELIPRNEEIAVDLEQSYFANLAVLKHHGLSLSSHC